MDFRAALVKNVKPFVPANASASTAAYRPVPRQPTLSSSFHLEPESSKGSFQQEPTNKRRRRRRRNNVTTRAQQGSESIPDDNLTLSEGKEDVTPRLPTVQVLEASPSLGAWKLSDDQDIAHVDMLHAVSERARERLATRIQAYWEGKQQVIEAASKIQQAYTTHIETQLRSITDSLKTHLSQEIDTKFVANDDKQHEKLDAIVSNIHMGITHARNQEKDSLRNHESRIEALEAQLLKFTEALKERPGPIEKPKPGGVAAISDVQHRIDQLYSLIHGLRLQHQEAMITIEGMQSFILTSSLLNPTRCPHNHRVGPSTGTQDQRAFIDANGTRRIPLERAPKSAILSSPTPTTNKENAATRPLGIDRASFNPNSQRATIDDRL